MSYTFFAILLIGLCGYSLWISRATAANAADNTDYYLSGRKLKVWSLMLTLLATQLGGGVIIGNGEAAFNYGWKAIYYSLGLSLGLLILSLGVGAHFRKLNISTLPELFQTKYSSSVLRVISALFSVSSLFLILVALGVATRKTFIGIGIDSLFVFFIFWLIAVFYTVIGGLSAVVKTDIPQVLFIIAALIFVFISLFIQHPEPLLGFKFQLEQNSMTQMTRVPWSEWILMPLMFVIIGQDMGQRCFAANSPGTVSKATFIAGVILLLLSAIPTFIGTLAAASHFQSPSGSILMNFVQEATNPYSTAIFAAAILMAILSTADSLICSISLNISHDILQKFFPNYALDIKISRLVTFIVGFSAIVLSTIFTDIIPIMIFAYKVSIYVLFAPIFMATFYKSPHSFAAYGSVLSGIILFIISEYYFNVGWFDLVSIILNIIIFIIINIMVSNFVKLPTDEPLDKDILS